MTARVRIAETDLMRLTELQREIEKHGTGPASFRPRWEFGCEVLRIESVDDDLENIRNNRCLGVGGVLSRAVGITPTEVSYRRRFARAAVTNTQADVLVAACSNWHDVLKVVGAVVEKNVPNVTERPSACTAVSQNRAFRLKGVGDAELHRKVHEAAALQGCSLLDFMRKAALAALASKQVFDAELQAITGHLANLRKEIVRVRAENKCERGRLRWCGDAMVAMDLAKLLDRVESELDKIPTTTTRKAQYKTAAEPNPNRGSAP